MSEDTVHKFKDVHLLRDFIAKNEFVAISFSSWEGIQYMYMNSTFTKLSKKHPNIKFIQIVEGEEENIFYEYNVTRIPTFRFLYDGDVVSEYTNANPKLVTKKVQAFNELTNIKIHKCKDEQSLNELFTNNDFLVVNFGSKKSKQSIPISSTFAELSRNHSKVKFIYIDKDEMPETFDKSGVWKIPTFMFLCDLDDIRMYDDISSDDLIKKVEEFSEQAEAVSEQVEAVSEQAEADQAK
ncbi:hypothetical protein IWW56_005882 [Coemansia sp. RSA 2131]|nr:hypothetical protein IWW56_005882 [Coemansia sp. RSA 2131]